MAALTLVPDTYAAKGTRFTYTASATAPEECTGCPFQRLCFGLEQGRRYEITQLRDVTHPCALHDGGRVRVAEVHEVPFATTVETRLLRGTAVSWAPVACGRPDCANYAMCHPAGTQPGRHEVVAPGEAVACPAGYTLTRADLRRMRE